MCSDSGSHDYTINRREAQTELGLNIEKPTSEQYVVIKSIYDDFSSELGFGEIFDPQTTQGAYAVRRGFLESVIGGSDFFVTEGRCSVVATQDGPALKVDKLFEGWRHDAAPLTPQIAQVITPEGEMSYEQDDAFRI